MVTRRAFFSSFTPDERILELAMAASPIVGMGLIPDLWQAMVNGTIRAMGRQSRAFKLNLIAYWLIATSLSFAFSFYADYGYPGIRAAILCAQLFLAVNYYLVVEAEDWQKVAKESLAR